MTEAPKTYMNSRGEQVIEIGMSGSRQGMTEIQKAILIKILEGKCGLAHHGDCIGADSDFHDILRAYYPDKWKIVIHPPEKNALRAFKLGDIIYPQKPYLKRNRDIVDACNVFLGFPKDKQEVGGTWSTINYFRRIQELEFGVGRNPRTGSIIMPNGDIGHILVEGKMGSKLTTQ